MNETEILKKLDAIESYAKLAAKNVLTMADVIILTGLSSSYLYKLTQSKTIPCYKPNGKVLYFKRAEVEAWMLQNRQTTAAEIEERAKQYINGRDSQ